MELEGPLPVPILTQIDPVEDEHGLGEFDYSYSGFSYRPGSWI